MSAAIDTSTPAVVLKLYHHGGLGVARSLGRLGVPVHGVHVDVRAPACRSRFLREVLPWDLDSARPEDTVQFLLDAGRRIGGRPVLVPTDDGMSMIVADHQEALAEVFRFPRQPAVVARRLYSKRGMYELCRAHGVPTPDVRFPTSRRDVERFADDARFPVVLKAIETAVALERRAERTVIAGDRTELLSAYDRLEQPEAPNLMLQEYIPGGAENVWMFNGYFDERSECRFAAVGRKLRQYPPATGMTSLGACAPNPSVEETTRAFMQALGYRGVLDCGYRWDPRDGRYKLLDVNPRVGATFRLFVGAAGLDVVRALYRDLTGQPIAVDAVPPGRKWLVENYDAVSAAKLCARGDLRLRAWGRSLRGVDELAWLSADDPAPFGSMALRFGALVAHRALRLERILPGLAEPAL